MPVRPLYGKTNLALFDIAENEVILESFANYFAVWIKSMLQQAFGVKNVAKRNIEKTQ